MKLEFGALGICVNDIAKMVEFYRNALGLDIDWDGGTFASARMSNGALLNFYKGSKPLPRDGINKTFQITCGPAGGGEMTLADVDREYERMIKAGAASVYTPRDEPYGFRVAWVADPEGNQIEICCPLDQGGKNADSK